MPEKMIQEEMVKKGEENPILAKIKNKVASKDREQELKNRGEALEKMYEEEGVSRAAERQKEEEKQVLGKTQYFSTSVRIALGEFKRFNDLAFKVKALGRLKLTYESIFILGLEALEGKSEHELEQYIQSQKRGRAR